MGLLVLWKRRFYKVEQPGLFLWNCKKPFAKEHFVRPLVDFSFARRNCHKVRVLFELKTIRVGVSSATSDHFVCTHLRGSQRTFVKHLRNYTRIKHCVSRRDVLAEFVAGNLCLDICNEVLDVVDSLSLLGNQLHHIGRRVVAHQEPVKVFVADAENLKKRAKLMSVRHLENKDVWHAGLSLPKETPCAIVSTPNHKRVHQFLVKTVGDLLRVVEQDLLYLLLTYCRGA